MPAAVTVALPVKDGGPLLAEVLEAVRGQRVDRDVELLVCDSGSRDGSVEVARRAGARVLEIPPAAFGHGRTRNLLAAEARGAHVAFLTQDATPASPGWLQALLDGFAAGPRVALVNGPYAPRPGAPVHVRRELAAFFARMPVRPVTLADLGDPPAPGPAAFASDANAALLRAAWEEVPFRDIAFAEDQALGLDLLRAGWHKLFMPAAAVVHSHHFRPLEQAARWREEFRALHEVFGHREPLHPRRVLGRVRAEVRADLALARREGAPAASAALRSLGYHAARAACAAAASRPLRRPGGYNVS